MSENKFKTSRPHSPGHAPRPIRSFNLSILSVCQFFQTYFNSKIRFQSLFRMELHYRNISQTIKTEPKLKFGIDRLLSQDPSTNHIHQVSKPVPTMAVPCSDCVSSLFRCCRLTPSELQQEQNLLRNQQDFPHHLTGVYATQQLIRPFATRPSKFKLYTSLSRFY